MSVRVFVEVPYQLLSMNTVALWERGRARGGARERERERVRERERENE